MGTEYVVCPECGGDGKETCTNPDHGFIVSMDGISDIGRLGCPCCGHDPDHKVKNGGHCEICEGTGKVTLEKGNGYIESFDVDIELDPWIKK